MLVDGNDLPADAALEADVAVIGAGAAGIPAALELAARGISVLLVESGQLKPTSGTSDLSRGTVVDPRHGPLERYRERVVGGTTRVWGGRVAPFDDIDFEARGHIGSEGWPIGRSDLDPYYRIAHDYLEAGDFDYDARSIELRPTRPIPDAVRFDSPSYHHDMVWRFSKPTDLGRRWRRHLQESPLIRLVYNSTCVGLTSERGHRIDGCAIRSMTGSRFTIRASSVVLAGGGLEVTRLLLVSRSDDHPEGVGNHSDLLGRFYLSHLTGNLGPFRWRGGARLQGVNYERDADGVYVRRTLSLRPDVQRAEGLLNFRAIVAPPPMSDPAHGSAVLSAGYLAKRYFLRRVPPEYDAAYGRQAEARTRSEHIRNVLGNLPELVRFAPWWVAKRIVPDRKVPSMDVDARSTSFFIHFDAEQRPVRASTVRLGSERDALGVPRLVVDWRVDDRDMSSLVRAHRLLADELSSAGIADSHEASDGLAERLADDLGVGSHHIGTTRMSGSPSKGVTDAECRVHGVNNLYVASSSVFPTAGVANPTLTIVALSIRIARTIARELGRA